MASEAFPWENQQDGQVAVTAEAEFDPNTWVVPSVTATKSADQIEETSGFGRDIKKPDDYDLIIVGFVSPKLKNVETHYQGRKVSYPAYDIGVKLADIRDRGQSIVDWFTLPPADSRFTPYYLEGCNDQGTGVGFKANQFIHFIERIGFPWAPGTPLPAEAANPGRWLKRVIRATVDYKRNDKKAMEAGAVPGEPDPTTGIPFNPRLQVVPFSYRATDVRVPAQASFPAMAGPQIPAPVLAPPTNNIPAPGRPRSSPAPAAARPVAPPQPATNGAAARKAAVERSLEVL